MHWCLEQSTDYRGDPATGYQDVLKRELNEAQRSIKFLKADAKSAGDRESRDHYDRIVLVEDLKKARAQLEAQRKAQQERVERERADAKKLADLLKNMMKADEEVRRWSTLSSQCLSHAPFPS